MKNEFATLSGLIEDVKPPKAVEWYQTLARGNLVTRGYGYDPFQLKSYEFLKSGQEFGSITRQEIVLMIPTQFLKVEPHHKVLDIVRAGSKTFRVLEALQRF